MRYPSLGMLGRCSRRGSRSLLPAGLNLRHPWRRTASIPGVVLLGLALLLAVRADAANFGVKNAKVVLDQRVLLINVRFDLPINARIEEALSNGIPIDLLIEVNLAKHRWWWRNKVITDHVLRRRILFHALSRQYLVSGLHARDSSESFGSLSQALAHAGALDELTIPLGSKKEIEADGRYLLVLRARLDIEALPMLMRPLAYATPSWRLNTGWTEWPVQRAQP
ncbi:MAG: DUF4390 domain-containing protein [Pseudomonadota bacterium]